ncbi:hypothetical protein NMY22_g14402 [Coprinellus aureogranulatus]|nr:hypothetical protein NMY22_g14402 [Coprinellus aureogranulatus]
MFLSVSTEASVSESLETGYVGLSASRNTHTVPESDSEDGEAVDTGGDARSEECWMGCARSADYCEQLKKADPPSQRFALPSSRHSPTPTRSQTQTILLLKFSFAICFNYQEPRAAVVSPIGPSPQRTPNRIFLDPTLHYPSVGLAISPLPLPRWKQDQSYPTFIR